MKSGRSSDSTSHSVLRLTGRSRLDKCLLQPVCDVPASLSPTEWERSETSPLSSLHWPHFLAAKEESGSGFFCLWRTQNNGYVIQQKEGGKRKTILPGKGNSWELVSDSTPAAVICSANTLAYLLSAHMFHGR